jgi:hypothetical protein
MAKFGNPLGNKSEVYITQTLHGSSNTAIDLYGAKYIPNLSVFAIADGTILGTSPNSGSFCYQSVNNSDLKVWYVHTHNWLAKGTKVKKGQKICEIAPTSKNGGFPIHLHLGLTPKGLNIMNYFDRSIPFRTAYSDIFKSWFASSGDIDWRHFQDLSYLNGSMIKVGDNVKLTADTRLRVGSSTNENIKTLVKKSAVGTIIGGPRTANSYEWWDIRFLDNQGWMANPGFTRLQKTPLPVTNTQGVIPEPSDPCKKYKDQVSEINSKITDYKKRIDILDVVNTELRTQLGGLQDQLDDQEAESERKYNQLRTEYNKVVREKGDCQEELSRLKNHRFNWILEWLDKVIPQKK